MGRTGRIRLLEVGCADSYWLPYFAKRYAAQVYGLDYSFIGCQQANEQLARRAVEGSLICGDFFEFSTPPREHFDVVISFGFIEHFPDPSVILQRMHGMLRPGGVNVAIVPNFTTIFGWLQRAINRRVYEGHVIMGPNDLCDYARRAGYSSIQTGYTGGAWYLGVLNFTPALNATAPSLVALLGYVARRLGVLVGRILEAFGINRGGRIAAPFIYVAAWKKDQAALETGYLRRKEDLAEPTELV